MKFKDGDLVRFRPNRGPQMCIETDIVWAVLCVAQMVTGSSKGEFIYFLSGWYLGDETKMTAAEIDLEAVP